MFQKIKDKLGKACAIIWEAVQASEDKGTGILSLDDLVRQTGLPSETIQTATLALISQGYIRPAGNQKVRAA